MMMSTNTLSELLNYKIKDMLVYSSLFKNHVEFAKLFGTPQSRENKIPLAALKSKTFFESLKQLYYSGRGCGQRLYTPRLVYSIVRDMLYDYTSFDNEDMYTVRIINANIKVPCAWNFPTLGVSETMNPSIVYYTEKVKTMNGYQCKKREVKAGRFIKSLIDKSNLVLTDEVINFVCEEFANKWKTFVCELGQNNLSLCVGDSELDFERAYSSLYYAGGTFDSCMENQDFHTFYTDSVDASIATLEDEDGCIFARCVIFNEVRDDDNGEMYRLAERQYACDEVYKRILIAKLISEKRIDGYKVFGSGCGDKTNFVSVDGEDLYDRNFSIKCTLEIGEPLSYQDSFYGYDYDGGRAYNYQSFEFNLSTTDGYIGEWDDYHHEYVRETVTVYVNGNEMLCNSEELDDFEKAWNGYTTQWTHRDELVWSDIHDCYIEYDYAIELHDGDYTLEKYAVELHDGRYAFKDDIIELHNGEYALEDEVVMLGDGKFALKCESVMDYDGNWHLMSK